MGPLVLAKYFAIPSVYTVKTSFLLPVQTQFLLGDRVTVYVKVSSQFPTKAIHFSTVSIGSTIILL